MANKFWVNNRLSAFNTEGSQNDHDLDVAH